MTARTAARTQFLTDIYVCALEGGIGYWSTCIEYRWSTTQRAVIEDLEDAVHEITLDTISHGINAVADGSVAVSDYLRNLIRAANRSNDAGDVDAIAADVIAQAGIMSPDLPNGRLVGKRRSELPAITAAAAVCPRSGREIADRSGSRSCLPAAPSPDRSGYAAQ